MIVDTPELKRFPLSKKEEVFNCPIFRVYKQTATSHENNASLDVFTFKCAHWVNVIPVTPKGEIVLVEQHRFGNDSFTLETPGGAVNHNERDLTMAALRELEEETGLTSQRLIALPGFGPNPALQDNRITYFIAFDAQPLQRNREHDDPFEQIKLHHVPIEEAIMYARIGKIQNALCALALLLAEPYLSSRLRK